MQNTIHYQPVQRVLRRIGIEKLLFQVQLLCWKRYCESTKSKWDLIKIILPALLFFTLLILIYTVFEFFGPGGLEVFFVPVAFWIYIQRLVVQIMYEKSSRLQESMRMMGLSDAAYWISYFLTDGVITGFVLSFLCTLMTIGGALFNGANFGVILGFLFVFCLAATTFSFFITTFFDSPQTASQATLAMLMGKCGVCMRSVLVCVFFILRITYDTQQTHTYIHIQM
ncbi:ABC transporter permease [archaeon]|nr:MAG: ABC transporter permease [archaeon]